MQQSYNLIKAINLPIDSIVRSLSASYEGGVLVVLSAALGECYHENHAANVLWELVQVQKPADSTNQTPSPTQWLALVRQCNGVLAMDEFPKTAEHFMRLHPRNRLDFGTCMAILDNQRRRASSPDSTAEALLGLGKVSTGQYDSITITGAADAGWLAAVADRFFNLRLLIHSPEENLLFQNFGGDERLQVRVLYEFDTEEAMEKRVEVSGKVYHLRDATEFLNTKDGAYGASLLCGRVPWQNALSLTFGPEFRRLTESPSLFGSAIGAAARLFDGLAKAEKGVHQITARSWTTYLGSGRGQGLISCAMLRFPELSPLEIHMETASKCSFKEAQGIYESNLSNLKRLCQYRVCKMGVKECKKEGKPLSRYSNGGGNCSCPSFIRHRIARRT